MIDDRQISRWVLRAQVGDAEALDRLLREVQQPLYRCVAGIVRDATSAEDILQDVFLVIFRKLKWLRNPELFKPWAYRIATRAAIRESQRASRRTVRETDPAALADVVVDAVSERDLESGEEVERLLDRVPPTNRPVLVLHYVQGLSLHETAEVLGVAVGTVKSRLSQSLGLLRQTISRSTHSEKPQ